MFASPGGSAPMEPRQERRGSVASKVYQFRVAKRRSARDGERMAPDPTCPTCDSPLTREDTTLETDIGTVEKTHWICSNTGCPRCGQTILTESRLPGDP